MKEGIKIAISGKSGCGNTTVSRMVAQRLGLRLINYTFHTMAEEKGMEFTELYRLAQEDLSYDRHLDKRQIELAHSGNCVLGSRLAIWILEDADVKVYLYAPLETRASRIMQREGGSFEQVRRETETRDRQDRKRFLTLYNIDNDVYDFADLILDVGTLDQYQAVEQIIRAAEHIEGTSKNCSF